MFLATTGSIINRLIIKLTLNGFDLAFRVIISFILIIKKNLYKNCGFFYISEVFLSKKLSFVLVILNSSNNFISSLILILIGTISKFNIVKCFPLLKLLLFWLHQFFIVSEFSFWLLSTTLMSEKLSLSNLSQYIITINTEIINFKTTYCLSCSPRYFSHWYFPYKCSHHSNYQLIALNFSRKLVCS